MTGSKTISRIKKNPGIIWEVSGVVIGILLFAIFIHDQWPRRIISFLGLTGSALVMGYSIRNVALLKAFGITPFSLRILFYLIPASILGTGLAWITRNTFNLTLLPSSAGNFILIAPLIGAAEELIFRGYVQGHLRPLGKLFSIIYTSTVHTCYKLLVILTLSLSLQFDFFFLVLWTFVGGIAFGALREVARNTIPAVVAHSIFDIILYGGLASAPLWVWS